MRFEEITLPNWAVFSSMIGITALFLSWLNFKRNNNFCIAVEDCRFIDRRNSGRDFQELNVLVRNYGLSLYYPSVRLRFWVDGEEVCIPLRRRQNVEEVTRGRAVRFVLRTDKISKANLAILSQLVDIREQRAAFCIYSQGDIVGKVPVDTLSRRVSKMAAVVRGKIIVTHADHVARFLSAINKSATPQ